MNCPNCGESNDDSYRFCLGCGETLTETDAEADVQAGMCLSCRRSIPDAAGHCPRCGSQGMSVDEFKLAFSRRSRFKSATRFLISLFVGTMAASAGVAVFPGLLKETQPLVCEETDQAMEVVLFITNPEPGTTVWNAELFCIDAQGTPREASYFTAAAAVGGATFVAVLVVLLLVRLFRASAVRSSNPFPTSLLVLTLLLAGCEWGTISPEQFEARYGKSPGQVSAENNAPPERLLFSVPELQNLMAELKSLKGDHPVRLTKLEVQRAQATVTMAKPGSETELFVYEYKQGSLFGPSTRKASRRRPPSQAAFEPSDIAFDRLPFMWSEAEKALDKDGRMTDFTMTGFVIERSGRGPDLLTTVYTAGKTMSGYVVFDQQGTMTYNSH